MGTMAGEGDTQTQSSNQHETFVEGNETLDEGGGTARKQLDPMSAVPISPQRRWRRRLMEVFSVKLPEFEKHVRQEHLYGCIFIHSEFSYVVFDRVKKGDPLNIDAEGRVRLRGPDMVITVADWVRFSPNLFRYQARSERSGPLLCEYDEEFALWEINTRTQYNMFLTEKSETQFGPIVTNYAVYNDGIEAWVDVKVEALQFPGPSVYGTVTARNSKLPQKEAESVLFDKKREECIYLDVGNGKFAHLPLTRSKTAQPCGSDVTISLKIMERGDSEAEDKPIANKDLCFSFLREGVQTQLVGNGVFRIDVSVTWHLEREPFNKVSRVL